MKILLVEDDTDTIDRIQSGLRPCGYDVVSVGCAEDANRTFSSEKVEMVILDRLLPSGDTLAAVQGWRNSGLKVPILVLSSLAGMTDRVAGLNAGADDYLTKPFHMEELQAKLNSLLRARDRHRDGSSDSVECGSIKLNLRRREAERAGKRLMLQPREFRLLEILVMHGGRVVPRSVLLQEVWNLNFDPRTKIIETHMSRLRDKLELAAPGDAIETVRGIGYRLRTDG